VQCTVGMWVVMHDATGSVLVLAAAVAFGGHVDVDGQPIPDVGGSVAAQAGECVGGHVDVDGQPNICVGGHVDVDGQPGMCVGGHVDVDGQPNICVGGHETVTGHPSIVRGSASLVCCCAAQNGDIPVQCTVGI